MDKILNILKEIRPDVDFINEENLIDDEILDSVDTMTIIASIEEEYDIEFSPMDLTADNFNSAKSILTLVERLINEQSH